MAAAARALAATAAVVLMATGCFRSDIGVVVNEDGSGEMTMVFAVNPEVIRDFGAGFGDGDFDGDFDGMGDPCEEIQADAGATAEELPTGATVEPFVDGDFCGVQMHVVFGAGDDVSRSIEQALGGQAEAGAGGFDFFRIERDGDGWVFEARPAGDESDLGFGGELDNAFTRQFLEGAANVVRVRLPGRQVEHNADRIADDGTMIWNLNVLGDSRTLHARTEPGEPITGEVFSDAGREVSGGAGAVGTTGSGGGGFPWLVVVILLAVAAAAGFLIWRRTQTATAPAGAAPGGPGGPAGGGGPTADPAPGGGEPGVAAPQWDPARNAYVQWDPTGQRWMRYDDSTGAWTPVE